MSDLFAKVLVLNTGPLITLAAAETLDYLLYPRVPVIVPNAVLYEATRESQALVRRRSSRGRRAIPIRSGR